MFRKILYSIVLLSIVECRKYDLEAESVKLYGEGVHSVLARFRKSADYLEILQDSLNDMTVLIADSLAKMVHHYTDKLSKRINDMLGIGKEATEILSKPGSENIGRYYPSYHPPGRQGDPEKKHEEVSTEKTSPIKILDGYKKLESFLTLAEKNGFIDVGFEFAGHIIHALIKSMGPDDLPTFKSTLVFYGVDDKKHTITTTEHASVHEVTTLTTVISTAESTAPIEAFRYRTSALHPSV